MPVPDPSPTPRRGPERKLRVLLAEDHLIVREGLKNLIDREPDMQVVGEAADGREVSELAARVQPDIVVMDVSMPHLNGIDATRRLKEAFPAIKVLALSGYEDRVYIRRMIEAGATGYVLKRAVTGELLRALRLVANGALYFDPEAARRLDGLISTPAAKGSGRSLPDLTPRETEVLRLIAWGFSNKEIAARLGITVKTVETHRARSMEKLDLQSRAAIVRLAIEQGWLQDPS
jgi:DNA-binding NarL/FixJ family response regulator